MKSFCLAVLLFHFISLGFSAPADPFDEVELIEPKNTNSETPGSPSFGGFPIVIVRTGGGRNPFGGFPFGHQSPFGGFPFHSQFPEEVEEVDPELPVPGIGTLLKTVFGVPHVNTDEGNDDVEGPEKEEEETVANKNCGLICTLIGDLGKIHSMVEDEIKNVHQNEQDKKNEVEEVLVQGEDADGNSTYTEEIRPDGTVVKTNRTVIKSPNGVSFVFSQTTSFSNKNTHTDTQPEVEHEEPESQEEGVNEDIPLLIENDEFADDGIKENEKDNEIEVGEDQDEVEGIDSGLLEIVE